MQPAERLKEYRRKRDFTKTLEPSGADAAVDAGCLYVMHRHAASHDHFDLRLEENGVLRSWALPRGASLEPGERRLAVEVEDHPLEYGGFEGVIPAGEYGGGTVMLWDAGRWKVNGKNKEGHLDFILDGQKLKGAWTLVRTRGRKGGRAKEGRSWLMIKRSDPGRPPLAPEDGSVASGRSMDEIARDHDRVWLAGEAVDAGRVHAEDIAGARRKPMPLKLEPQLATSVEHAPEGREWIHEIKFDGYRVIARIDDGKVSLFTRNGHDWTHRFPEVARSIAALPVKRAIIDGEVVAISNDGYSSFRRLQEALSSTKTASLVYQAFDLPYLDDRDLAGAPLLERKHALSTLVHAAGDSRVRYSDHIEGQGAAFFEQACQLGLEGIISKRRDAPYRSGRNRQWLKVKCTFHEEFVVGGFTPPGGARTGFGSLLLGAWENDAFRYAGRVGTGFSARQIDELHDRLRELDVKAKPFADDVPDARGARWVEPVLVIEVEFTERTRDGRLRHPVFRGVREDRNAREITLNRKADMREEPVAKTPPRARVKTPGASVAGVRITHPDRIMYPELGITKLDIARYYEDIETWVMPGLMNRPLSLLRCPEGWNTECFFQKHPRSAIAKDVPRVLIAESKGPREYAYVQSLRDIAALVQAGVLEFHPWGCHVSDVEKPDLMVFDLDPAPDVPWREMLRVADELRERLASLDLASFLRTTGGKGLHLVVPLKPKADWDEVKSFAQAIAKQHASDDPKHITANLSKTKRRGRIFIDYLRNGRGATAIASYSLRARENAPVAVPLRWDELGEGLRPDHYNIDNLRRRLGALRDDPWKEFDAARRLIGAKARKAAGVS